MNRVFLLLMVFLLGSCHWNTSSDTQQAIISDPVRQSKDSTADTVPVDLAESKVLWKGTKMRGTGKHEGTIQLQEAVLLAEDSQLVGGCIIIDMHSIAITDIPKHEPIPRKRLRDHLKSEDFFDVQTYPISSFEITSIEQLSADSLNIQGNLTIKGISKNISFAALQEKHQISTSFTFDRFEWNIAYEGSWIDKTLVDRDIELTIQLKIKH